MKAWSPMALAVLLAGCAGARAVPPPAAAQAAPREVPAPPSAPPASLYTRLGGLEALRAVVPRFQQHVAADERINHFFAMSDLVELRSELIAFFCGATGGPCKYTGRDMRAAHAWLAIGPEHYDALVEDLVKTFDEFHVGEREQREVLAALTPLRGDIVNVR